MERPPENTPQQEQPKESWEGLVKSVEFLGEQKPRIEISDYAAIRLDVFEQDLQREAVKHEPTVVAVVRCWKKDLPALEKFQAEINHIYQEVPSLKGVFLVINKDADAGSTEKNLTHMAASEGGVPIIPIAVERYTWTAGLNSAASVLNEICLRNAIDRESVKVMNMSFDVHIEDAELEKIRDSVHNNDYAFTARETTEGDSPFDKKEAQALGKEIWEKFAAILRDPHSSDLSQLSYMMRNTFNIIKLSDVVKLGGFNPLTNGKARKFSPAAPNPAFFTHYDPKEMKVSIQGMEDIEFFMRLVLGALKHNEVSVIKALRKAFSNPILYQDTSWNELKELKKISKISGEMTALSLILSGVASREYAPTPQPGMKRTIGLTRDFYVPEAMQDFRLRKS